MMEIDKYDSFINMSNTISKDIILEKMYNGMKDNYYKNNMKLMENNLGSYWCGLDEKNKKKLIVLLNDDVNNIGEYDKIILYASNVDESKFMDDFFVKKEDIKSKTKKLILMRNNIKMFWNNMSENEKMKYLELANNEIQ